MENFILIGNGALIYSGLFKISTLGLLTTILIVLGTIDLVKTKLKNMDKIINKIKTIIRRINENLFLNENFGEIALIFGFVVFNTIVAIWHVNAITVSFIIFVTMYIIGSVKIAEAESECKKYKQEYFRILDTLDKLDPTKQPVLFDQTKQNSQSDT